MRRFVIGFLVFLLGGLVSLVCIAGFIGFVTLVLPEERKEILVLPEEIEGIFGKVREIEIVGKLRERITGIEREERGVVTPESQMVDVEEEYYNSVNAEITLEQLENSKVVRDIEILNEGGPVATAYVIMYGEVVKISDRTLTLNRKGDVLSVYIGENVEKISLFVGGVMLRKAEFEEVRIGDFVDIQGTLQYARGDPLRINWLDIYRR